MKNLLLVFALLFSIATFAVKPATLDKTEKIEIVKPDIATNFVNLNMAVNDFIKFQRVSKFKPHNPREIYFSKSLIDNSKEYKEFYNKLDKIRQDVFCKTPADLFKDKIQEKNLLIESKIKEHIPEFTLNTAENYKDKLFAVSQNNETTYLLRHNNKEIRLITFGKETLPLKTEGNTVYSGFKEYYY